MRSFSEIKKIALNTFLFKRVSVPNWLSKLAPINIELILACLVGVGAGFAAVFFRYLLHIMERFFFGVVYPWLSGFSIYLLPVIPVIGAVLLIPFSLRYPGEVNGYGMSRFLVSVHLKGGLIRTRQIFVKILTSAITISTGGSAGVEGPIAQVGGAVGSSVGRFFEMGSHRLKVLIACGSAAGIAAQFNAPLAGVLFAQEIIMVGQFQLQTFGVIVISSGLATAISRAYYSAAPTFGLLHYNLNSYYELVPYSVLGLAIGVSAYFFIRLFFYIGDHFDQMKIHSQLKPIVGAFLVGVMGLLHFGVLGDGYKYITDALQSPSLLPIGAVALLVILKMLATSITLGSGNVGGVFAPSLFIGAMIGAVFGWVVNFFIPYVRIFFPQIHNIQPGSYALVGMGAFLAAATHAPMTSIFLLFELTGDYNVIIPIMFASVIGVMLAKKLCPDSLDSMELSRRDIHLHKGVEANILNSILVENVMLKEFETLEETTSFAEFISFFPVSKEQYYPIMDKNNKMTGVVSFQDIREIILEEGLEQLVVMKDLAETDLIRLFPHDSLNKAIKKFGVKDIEAIPIVDPEDHSELLGILKRKDVIDAYNKAVLMRDIQQR